METFSAKLAALLGVVEGLTEFLPVSSTGHLIMIGHLLGFTGDIAVSVEICIQLGAVLAVLIYEREQIASLLRGAASEQAEFRRLLIQTSQECGSPPSFWQSWKDTIHHSMSIHQSLWFVIGLGVAFLPAAIVGLLTHHWIEAYLFSAHTVAVSLIIGGLIILTVETWPKPVRYTKLEQVGLWTALGIGVAQCVALIPGMSRSGSTIVGALAIGLDRKIATEYSFFLALPTMLAATGYKFLQSYHLFSADHLAAMGVGLLAAFAVAWAVIALFLSFVKRHTLKVFAYYRILLGSLLLTWL
ncbi:MAG: undecaprenyl-diphosphate phosphatase [Nitrospirae bacterium]|nr:MAG: undecaprenyl-diphosphate phosphatase [Nitrospirota bacterium]